MEAVLCELVAISHIEVVEVFTCVLVKQTKNAFKLLHEDVAHLKH